MFASKNNVLYSVLDALGMGVGFTLALFLIGTIREILGSGTIFGFDISFGVIPQATLFILPAGGFLVLGLLMALYNKLTVKKKQEFSCATCPIQCHVSKEEIK